MANGPVLFIAGVTFDHGPFDDAILELVERDLLVLAAIGAGCGTTRSWTSPKRCCPATGSQCQENSLDPVHAEWLHNYFGNYVAGIGPQVDGAGTRSYPRAVGDWGGLC